LLADVVELRRTEYDLDEAAELISATGYPGAVDLLENAATTTIRRRGLVALRTNRVGVG
jgi:hypothetical protein